jgi:hypothetical protein
MSSIVQIPVSFTSSQLVSRSYIIHILLSFPVPVSQWVFGCSHTDLIHQFPISQWVPYCSALPSQQIPNFSHTDLIHLFLVSQWVPYCSYTDLFTSSHSVDGIFYCSHTGLVHQFSANCSSIVCTLVTFTSSQLVNGSFIIHILVLFSSFCIRQGIAIRPTRHLFTGGDLVKSVFYWFAKRCVQNRCLYLRIYVYLVI